MAAVITARNANCINPDAIAYARERKVKGNRGWLVAIRMVRLCWTTRRRCGGREIAEVVVSSPHTSQGSSAPHQCRRPGEGDVDNQAEQIALAIVLSVERGAKYDRPESGKGVRTPDWVLILPDGRLAALEVTAKETDYTYEDWPEENGTYRVGTLNLNKTPGDREHFQETLRRKMKDKAEHGQLAGDHEKWLCVQLDRDAGAELDLLMLPHRTNVIAGKTGHPYSYFGLPDFDQEMDDAAWFNFDEVWCITRSRQWPHTTLVLRLLIKERQWCSFCLRHQFHFEPPCECGEYQHHDGYIASRLNPQ